MESAKRTAVQRYEETADERKYRKQAGFKDIEDKMPSLKSRRATGFIDNITSYLGERNPFTHPVNTKDHSIWLLDNTASQAAEGEPWQAEVVAAYFLKNSGQDESKIVADLAALLSLADDEEAKKTITQRIQPLLDTVVPAHTVNIAIGGSKTVQKLGPSDRDGISTDIVTYPGTYTDGQTIVSNAVNIESATPCTTTFADSTGWAVISDIDDTIKKTMTSSPLGILKTSFVDSPEPIVGMPELYAHIKTTLDTPPFWYLSASPYNLYPFLRSFREQFYPPGTMILREASWMNLAGFLTSLTQGTEAYKVSRIERIHAAFPGRKFLCIGDSTQSDPEAYGDIYRKFPGWVGAIFIRKVKDVEPMDESEKNKPERFEKAFKDVPTSVWTVFEDPKELAAKVDALVAEDK
jgi:phosphatidate phosphatase APP1